VSAATVNELGPAVRGRRIELGLRQRELADLAGCSPGFVAGLETGKPSVQLGKVLAVCGVLGLDLTLTWGDGSLVSGLDTVDSTRQRVSGKVRRTR